MIVASQPTGAPSWFPCNDAVGDRATYSIRVSVDQAYSVITNGELVDLRIAAGRGHWHYRQTEPTSTYLATVQIGRYELERTAYGTLAFPAALRERVRADYAENFDALIAISHVVATNFQTVSAANGYWRS